MSLARCILGKFLGVGCHGTHNTMGLFILCWKLLKLDCKSYMAILGPQMFVVAVFVRKPQIHTIINLRNCAKPQLTYSAVRVVVQDQARDMNVSHSAVLNLQKCSKVVPVRRDWKGGGWKYIAPLFLNLGTRRR
jgi:hypothetical protein